MQLNAFSGGCIHQRNATMTNNRELNQKSDIEFCVYVCALRLCDLFGNTVLAMKVNARCTWLFTYACCEWLCASLAHILATIANLNFAIILPWLEPNTQKKIYPNQSHIKYVSICIFNTSYRNVVKKRCRGEYCSKKWCKRFLKMNQTKPNQIRNITTKLNRAFLCKIYVLFHT